MAYQGINTGTSPNDNTGDSLLEGAIKINSNFEEIYDSIGVSVSQFSPTPDGEKDPVTGVITGTDNTIAFRNALDYLTSIGGGTLHIPRGKYTFYNNSSVRLEINSNIKIVGDGSDQTILYFNDSAGTSRRDFISSYTSNRTDFIMEDLAIIGDWGANNDYTQRSHLVAIDSTDAIVRAYRCRFEYSRFFGYVVGYNFYGNTAVCVDCSFYRIAGDGFSVRNNKHMICSNNYFKDVNDDSIAFHTREPQTSPVQTSAIIVGNQIIDSQGICLLGCKDTIISNNTLTRTHTRAIQIGGPWLSGNDGEGKTPSVGILISNNVIDTVFDGNAFSGSTGSSNHYIYIDGISPNAIGGNYVGGSDGSGGILSPYEYFYNNDVGDVPPSTGNWFVNISNNICVRTYNPTSNYSDYGYGARYARTGISDPQITSTTLGYNTAEPSALIHLNTRSFNTLIANNVLDGHATGIKLSGSNSSNFTDWQNVLISNNIITNFSVSGIDGIGTGMIEVNSNLIDGDPFCINENRGANGTWTFIGNLSHSAIRNTSNDLKILVKNNTFKNVQTVLITPSQEQVITDNNTYYFNPSGLGFNSSNVGIGYFESSYIFDKNPNAIIFDGNPSSSSYGKVINLCVNMSTSLPTSGKYIENHLVRKIGTGISGSPPNRYMIYGWKRLTTGSSHVLNTDWVELRTPIE